MRSKKRIRRKAHRRKGYKKKDGTQVKPTIVRSTEYFKNINPVSGSLYGFALEDPDPSIRKEAIDTIGDLEQESDLELLEFSLLNDPSEKVRKEAAEEIGDIHSPSSIPTLKRAIYDESPKVRKEAIESLRRIIENNSKRSLRKYGFKKEKS